MIENFVVAICDGVSCSSRYEAKCMCATGVQESHMPKGWIATWTEEEGTRHYCNSCKIKKIGHEPGEILQ